MQELTGKNQRGKEEFIKVVLQLLDEGVKIREMNLRQVARVVGCAHTNAYNYFSGFEELLWFSLKSALEQMVENTLGTTAGNPGMASIYIHFALEHPAWYRLIWMDQLAGPPPREVSDYLAVPGRVFLDGLARILDIPADDPELNRKASILHSFLHGELSAMATGRKALSTNYVPELMESTGQLFALLFNSDPGLFLYGEKS